MPPRGICKRQGSAQAYLGRKRTRAARARSVRQKISHPATRITAAMTARSASTGVSSQGVSGGRMKNPATFSSVSNVTRAFMAPAS